MLLNSYLEEYISLIYYICIYKWTKQINNFITAVQNQNMSITEKSVYNKII